VSVDALVAVDVEALDDAGVRAHLHALAAAESRVAAARLRAIAALDGRCAYLEDGAVSAAGWLAHETGLARVVAGAWVLLAKRLRRMPAMAEALAAGTVTEAHARSLGRCLTPRTRFAFARDEAMLVETAAGLEADDFDRVVSRWLAVNDTDGPDPGSERPSEVRASRHFRGRVRLDGDLDVEDGTEVLAELDHITDLLWRADQTADPDDPTRVRTRAQRCAAALVEMARRSSTTHHSPDTTRPRRPQLVVVVDPAALTGDPAGEAVLEDGTLLPRSVLERWTCDTAIGRVVMTGRSQILDLGALTYTPSPAQRRALIARDRHCIVPGCQRRARWCEAHHVVPWPHGPTALANLVLLCARHHKAVHHHQLQLEPAGHRWRVVRPDGTPLRVSPPPNREAA
jgi:hypothetical protein